MQIIKRILSSIGLYKKETESKYKLNDDDDLSFTNEHKLKDVKLHYDRSEEQRRKTEKDKYTKAFFAEKNKNKKIAFEFCPKSQNFRNARSALHFITGDYKKWTEVRNYIENKNDGVCIICKKTSHDYQDLNPDKNITTNTECHEVWSYRHGLQRLVKLEPVCYFHHQIKHINMHKKDDQYFYKLMEEYCELNDIDIEDGLKDYETAIKLKRENDNINFKLDLSLLNKLNLEIDIYENFDCHEPKFNKFLELDFKTKHKQAEED